MKFEPMPQLTFYERQIIESGVRRDLSNRQIAGNLRRDHRVIDREIERNSSPFIPYTALVAQTAFELRQKIKCKNKLEKHCNLGLREYVIEKIKDDWSPEQIAGRLKNAPPQTCNGTVSHETIYQYIYNGAGKFEYLFPHLRTKRPKRRPKLNRKKRSRFLLENRVSIHERPCIIDARERIGDWEDDSMLFHKQRSTLAVQYERKGMLCRIKKLPDKTAEEHENAIRQNIESLPKELWKSITRDNGTENAKHFETNLIYDVPTYFCDGYSSWQKGGVENLNKLIRQYLPRNIDLAKLNDEDIRLIQERLNNRPRKKLNYLTPNETFANHLEGGAFTP
jgi:IS30 family transposase